MESQDAERNKNKPGGGRTQDSQRTSSSNQSGSTGNPIGTTHKTGATGSQRGERSSMNKGRSEFGGSDSGGDLMSGIKNTGIWGVLGAVAAGTVLYKVFSGSSGNKTGSKRSIDIHTQVRVNRSREELYDYWRNLENLPNFMTHLEEVNEIDDKRSTWTAKIPGGMGTVEWDAEIVRERKNHLLAWRSLPDSEIENSGEVRFENAPNGKGTIVETTISYRPPAGEVGGYAAKLFNPAFEKTIKSDLKDFKKVMEKGGSAKRRSSPSSRM